MKWIFKTLVVTGMAVVAGFAATVPAQASSIQSQFNGFSIQSYFGLTKDARMESLRLALAVEAYRNIKSNHFTKCMEENLILRDDKDPPGYGYLVQSLTGSKDKEHEPVEGKILDSIDIFCGSGGVETVSAETSTYQPTPVKIFFGNVPDNTDKINVLRLALSTQALRIMKAGDEQRSLCIMDRLVNPTMTNGKLTLSPDLKNLTQALARASNSMAQSVEDEVMKAIVSQCGEEKPSEEKHPSSG